MNKNQSSGNDPLPLQLKQALKRLPYRPDLAITVSAAAAHAFAGEPEAGQALVVEWSGTHTVTTQPGSPEALQAVFAAARPYGFKPEKAVAALTIQAPPEKFTIAAAVEQLRKHLPPIVTANGVSYEQVDGAWVPRTDSDTGPWRKLAYDLLPRDTASDAVAGEVLRTFVTTTQVDPARLKPAVLFDGQGAVVVNTLNGVWRVTVDEVKKIEPQADWLFTGRLQASYDPAAPHDLFTAAVESGLPDRRNCNLLFWMLGYCLYPSCAHEIALVIKGKAGCGKSTVVGAVGAIMGHCAKALDLADICAERPYALPDLEHALLNIGTDIHPYDLSSSANFGKLVSGEPINVARKYGQPFDMKSICKLIFCANHLPRFKQGSDAELRRTWLLLWTPFKKKDVTMKDKVARQADGIFSTWMIPALQAILDGAPCPPGHQALTELFATENDPYADFICRRIVVTMDETDWVSSAIIKRTFEDHLEEHGLNPKYAESFYRRFNAALCGQVERHRLTEEPRPWGYRPIKLKMYEHDEHDQKENPKTTPKPDLLPPAPLVRPRPRRPRR